MSSKGTLGSHNMLINTRNSGKLICGCCCFPWFLISQRTSLPPNLSFIWKDYQFQALCELFFSLSRNFKFYINPIHYFFQVSSCCCEIYKIKIGNLWIFLIKNKGNCCRTNILYDNIFRFKTCPTR